MSGAVVRPAGPGDLRRLQAIERAAGAPFRAIGMDAVADHEPDPVDVLARYAAAGRAWLDAIGARVAMRRAVARR